MIILIILIIVLLLSLSIINKTLKNKNIKLDNDNKLNENVINKKRFSMYVKNDNGEYDEYKTSNIFPEGYKINLNKSKCVDNNGLEAKNVLSGSGNKVTITSNKTVFCYVYFDKFCKEGETLSNCIIRNSNEGVEEIWNSPLEGDGYRYVGTNPDNYICFGTNDKNECVNDTDKYMYRIIGVFEDSNEKKYAKLIKREALNTAYAWHSDGSADVDWDNSDLYNGLNGSYFLTNPEYSYMQDISWTDKIATWNYTMTNTKTYKSGGLNYKAITAKDMYLHELNRSSKISSVGEWKKSSSKIGLMYVSDYALSLGSDALSYTSNSNYSTMKIGWMHLSNNDIVVPCDWEWIMSRFGKSSSNNEAWSVRSHGYMYNSYVYYEATARPVFYLESNIELSTNSGDGSLTNPYLIK